MPNCSSVSSSKHSPGCFTEQRNSCRAPHFPQYLHLLNSLFHAFFSKCKALNATPRLDRAVCRILSCTASCNLSSCSDTGATGPENCGLVWVGREFRAHHPSLDQVIQPPIRIL